MGNWPALHLVSYLGDLDNFPWRSPEGLPSLAALPTKN
ncbi:hypothetical protein D082_29160 [Synechocystis sp. PCC 6714]|nr:hypothetical protein D082_29160 [Synechocystis sp. PCC 6714]